jgi:protein gp37
MTDRTGIEWTDSTWNPVTGCTEVSAGSGRGPRAALSTGARGTSTPQRPGPTVAVGDVTEAEARPRKCRSWR